MLTTNRRIKMNKKQTKTKKYGGKVIRRSAKADAPKAKQTMLVISLPSEYGLQMKNTLQSMAAEESRSLSNLAALILKKHLTDLGKM